MEKLEAISYFGATQMLHAAQQEVTVANNVTVTIGNSMDYGQYALSTSHCYVISIKGQLVYVIDVDLQRLIYFISRANTLSVML